MKKIMLSLLAFVSLTACGNLLKGDGAADPKAFQEAWTPQYSHLQSYWSMDQVSQDDGSPFAAVRGVSGRVLNANGEGLTLVNGVVKSAIAFDGIDDRINIPYNPINNPLHFSVSAWIYLNNSVNYGVARTIISSQDVAPTRGYSIAVTQGNQIQASFGSGSSSWAMVGTYAINANQWNHVLMSYDGQTASIYVNGNLAGQGVASLIANTRRPLYIGAGNTELDPQAGAFFSGDIDEVGIWDVALSADDVQAIYKTQTGN